ncbi:MAG: Xaa-Pro peptidase family protein [Veillonellales bacterium]
MSAEHNIKQRIARLQSFLSEQHLDGMIISRPENCRYFSGFTGSAGMLLISNSATKLLTDSRYTEQAEKQTRGYEIIQYSSNPYATLDNAIQQLQLKNVGFEQDYITYDVFSKMRAILTKAVLVPSRVNHLRMVKDADELAAIKKAVAIADAAFENILTFIRPDMSEQDISFELEFQMRRLGAEKMAFDMIVASGQRGALPHGAPSAKKIVPGEMITMDFGAVYQGYHSDITRTIVVGQATPKQRKIYDLVLAAQLTGIQATRAGLLGSEVDAKARQVIEAAGYGDFFGHGLGHSVGLTIHEEPRLSPSNTDTQLRENMVVTVEPGIYLPGWGGVRIEDTVVVSAAGCEVLTASSKELKEING